MAERTLKCDSTEYPGKQSNSPATAYAMPRRLILTAGLSLCDKCTHVPVDAMQGRS